MKTLAVLFVVLSVAGVGAEPVPQQNTAKTEVPGAGLCTNFPVRYQRLEERLAWFYGCMHENPPSVAEIRAKIADELPDTFHPHCRVEAIQLLHR
jgi:hypothetical protein